MLPLNTLQVPSGRRVKIELVNQGPGTLEFENDAMNIEKVWGEGTRSFVVLPPLAPGEHEFVDVFNPVTGALVIHARRRAQPSTLHHPHRAARTAR